MDDAKNPLALPRQPLSRGGEFTLELAEALLEIRDLHDGAGRATLVHAIGEALGTPLLLPAYDSPKVFLYNLVVTCQEFPSGLQALVRAVDFLAGHTSVAARIRRLASPVQGLLESSAESRIQELLDGFTVPSLARLYYEAAGGSVSAIPRHLTDAWDAFSILLDANAGPGSLPPHLVFVELLIQVMRRRHASGAFTAQEEWRLAELRDWMNVQVERLRAAGGVNAASQLDRVRDRPVLHPVSEDQPIYLIIQLERVPDLAEDRELCRLSHWRQFHPLEWRPEPGDDRVVSLDEVPTQVAELIHEAESGWAYELDDSLVLEFVLPLDLLNMALDEWTRDPPGTPYPTPLGTEYELLVRSRDRLRSHDLHRAWRQRWRVLADAIECAAHWAASEGPADPERLRDWLLTRKDVVACVLSCPPDREPGRSELQMALRTGVPVVLWPRDETTPAEFRDALGGLVERHDLRSLPSDIKLLRGNAMLGKDGTARAALRLTLLWDDPTHFLDGVQPLQPPGRQ
ncbi:MAG: hypothetical protein JWN52_1542 [Actinomycetia bacterium]|nr:hypothetical protein [Actinomycetes bacterium]